MPEREREREREEGTERGALSVGVSLRERRRFVAPQQLISLAILGLDQALVRLDSASFSVLDGVASLHQAGRGNSLERKPLAASMRIDLRAEKSFAVNGSEQPRAGARIHPLDAVRSLLWSNELRCRDRSAGSRLAAECGDGHGEALPAERGRGGGDDRNGWLAEACFVAGSVAPLSLAPSLVLLLFSFPSSCSRRERASRSHVSI